MQILLYLHSFITRISTEFVYVTTLCSTIVCTNLQTSVSRLTYIGIWDRQSPGTTSLRHEFEASPGKWNKRHVPFVVVNYSWYYRRRLKLVSSVMASCDKKLKKSVSLYEKIFLMYRNFRSQTNFCPFHGAPRWISKIGFLEKKRGNHTGRKLKITSEKNKNIRNSSNLLKNTWSQNSGKPRKILLFFCYLVK